MAEKKEEDLTPKAVLETDIIRGLVGTTEESVLFTVPGLRSRLNDFAQTFSGIVTIENDLIIQDDGYIGSVSDIDAIKISATGSVFITSTRLGTNEGSYNSIIGSAFAAKTGYTYNSIVGSSIANSALGSVHYNSIVGSSIANSALGSVHYNSIAGSSIANSVLGTVAYTFSVGLQNLYNTTNVTNLYRVIALPYEALMESSASNLDDAIAIGYRAGYQNAYNSPMLLGREAVAAANNQIVIGSSFYTGGTALMGGKVGINAPVPQANIHVVGTSAAPNGSGTTGVAHISTGTGALEDDKLMIGVVDGSYSWLQAIDSDVAYRNLALNPLGGNVSIGTTSSAASALLELSSTTGALLLTRMTTTQKNVLTAVNGMLVYDATLNKFQGYENGSWTSLI